MLDFNEGALQMLLAFGFIVLVIALVVVILGIIMSWKMFVKAGRDGWISLVPFYNTWTMAQMAFGDKYGWVGLVSVGLSVISNIVSVAALSSIFSILILLAGWYLFFYLYKSFGLNTGLAIVGLFIPIIPMFIIAFGKNTQYQGAVQCKLHELIP